LSKALPLENLPSTVTDAISFTRKLGIRYLWVDALCIIQDDENDKNKELRGMGRIYQFSTVTLAEFSSKTFYDGFVHTLAPPDVEGFPLLPFRLPNDDMASIRLVKNSPLQGLSKDGNSFRPGEHLLPDDELARRELLHQIVPSQLDRRAWTFQEFFLSGRMILFEMVRFTGGVSNFRTPKTLSKVIETWGISSSGCL
jgi:hypothetical protein